MDEEALKRAFAAGQAAWPDVGVALSMFRAHCRRVLGASPRLGWQRFGADLFLCCGCARGDAAALRALDGVLLSQVAPSISRVEAEPGFIEEGLQLLRYRLLVGPSRPKIAEYAGQGPLVQWLGVAAARAALDLLRR